MEAKAPDNSHCIPNLDINNQDFYENVQTEIDTDLARMKKTVEVMMNLRLTAAELEVETAALYHAELWFDLLNMQNNPDANGNQHNKKDGTKL